MNFFVGVKEKFKLVLTQGGILNLSTYLWKENSIDFFSLIHQICDIYLHFQLISVGSNYNYGSEDQAEFLCVVSRDVSDSQEQGAGGTEQSDKAKVMREVMIL